MEYKAARISHSRHDFSILVTLYVHTDRYSGQGQCEQLDMDGYLFIHECSQDQAEKPVYTLLYFCRLCFRAYAATDSSLCAR